MPFQSYAAAGFGSELLPILPPDAAISPQSPSRENLERSRGKVPGRLTRQGWTGFGGWTEHIATYEDCAKWSQWKSGLGLQGRRFPAVDIDIEWGELADAIEAEALFTLGLAPCRFGRGARRALVYHGAGLKKRRLAFRIDRRLAQPAAGQPGGAAGASDRGADDLLAEGREAEATLAFAVEFLGDGQQYVAEGIHPKTLEPYYWRDGSSPVQWGAEGLTVVTAAEVDQFFENIRWLVEEMYDGEIVDLSGTGRAGDEGSNGTWQPGLRAPSLQSVQDALASIDNDLDYDTWIKLMAATKAATEGFEL